jgi:hypothetical protein
MICALPGQYRLSLDMLSAILPESAGETINPVVSQVVSIANRSQNECSA